MELKRREFITRAGLAAAALLRPALFAGPDFLSFGNQDAATITTTPRKLRFGVEVLDQDFDKPDVLTTVESNLKRHGIEEVLFWGGLNVLNDTAPVPEFAKYVRPGKPAQVERLKEWLTRFQKHGVRLVADGREPQVDVEFLDAYPEARRATNGQLWESLKKRIQAVFKLAPQLDRIESFLWETWLLNNDHFFEQMYWNEDGRGFTRLMTNEELPRQQDIHDWPLPPAFV